MSHATLLSEPSAFDGDELRVEGEPYRHLFRARRLAVGDRLRVVDGRGRERWAEVARVDRAAAVLALGAPAPPGEPAFELDLLVPTCRPERASWLVEKATELGVASIRFLRTERAPRQLGDGALGRLRRVAAAALEQCHGSRLPEITGPHEWSELAALAAGRASRWVLDPAAAPGGWGALVPPGALLIGPEGGWSAEEQAEVRAAGWRPVGLGGRVLRLETAAVVGAALALLGKIDPADGSG